MNSPEAKEMPKEIKEMTFTMLKRGSFDISELEIKNVKINEDTAIIIYGRKAYPNLQGKVELVKENGNWKIKLDSTKNSN